MITNLQIDNFKSLRLILKTKAAGAIISCMSTVEEIQTAIEKLSLSERGRIAKWFNGWEDDDWDRKMAEDFGPGGRYRGVPDRVNEEIKRGPLSEPP